MLLCYYAIMLFCYYVLRLSCKAPWRIQLLHSPVADMVRLRLGWKVKAGKSRCFYESYIPSDWSVSMFVPFFPLFLFPFSIFTPQLQFGGDVEG